MFISKVGRGNRNIETRVWHHARLQAADSGKCESVRNSQMEL